MVGSQPLLKELAMHGIAKESREDTVPFDGGLTDFQLGLGERWRHRFDTEPKRRLHVRKQG